MLFCKLNSRVISGRLPFELDAAASCGKMSWDVKSSWGSEEQVRYSKVSLWGPESYFRESEDGDRTTLNVAIAYTR